MVTLTEMFEPHADICGNCKHREKAPIAEPVAWSSADEKCRNLFSSFHGDPVGHWHTCSKFERRS